MNDTRRLLAVAITHYKQSGATKDAINALLALGQRQMMESEKDQQQAKA